MSAEADALQPVAVPIEYKNSEGVIVRYSNAVLVSHTAHEFMISFYELWPPVIVPDQDIKQQIEQISSVVAECVGRIVISPAMITILIEALAKNHNIFLAKTNQDNNDATD